MTSTGSHTPGMPQLGSPKKSSLQALPGPLNKGGPAGSPTKSPTKQLPRYMEVGAPKSMMDPKLGPRSRANVRNLPKIERKSATVDKAAPAAPEKKSERKLKQERDAIRALRATEGDGGKTGSGIGKRSIVNGVKELDPVKESPGENQEEE